MESLPSLSERPAAEIAAPATTVALRRTASAVLVLGGAVVAGLALEEPLAGVLSWLALAPLLHRQRISSPAASALWTALTTAVFYAVVLRSFAAVSPVGYPAMVLGTALIYGLAACLVTTLYGGERWSPLGVASVWVLAELAKSALGLEWGSLGYGVWSQPAVLHIAKAIGAAGISWLVWWSNACAALWLGGGSRNGASWRSGAALAGGFALAVASTLASPAPTTVGRLTVAVVPVHASNRERQLSHADPGLRARLIARYFAATRTALAGTAPPRLAVWPETALNIFAERDYWLQSAFASAPLPAGTFLITGALGDAGDVDLRYNSAFAFDRHGRLLGRYDKRRLAPLFESQPLPWLWELFHRGQVFDGFTPGAVERPLPLPIAPVAVSICYEETFPGGLRRQVADGAQLLVMIGSHTLFDDPLLNLQTQRFARFRAVENGRWLVRSINGGTSEVIAPHGRTFQSFSPPVPAAQVSLPLLTGRTFYVQAGHRAIVLLPLAGVAWGIARRRLRAGHRIRSGE